MIFITTGTQAPFSRLVKAMDEIALYFPDKKFIMQAQGVDFEVKNISIVSFLTPEEFNKLFTSATLIVSHAGMGSIIYALTLKKRIVVVPRYASLNEHRNDHQLATAKKMEDMIGIPVVYDITELKSKIDELINQERKAVAIEIGSWASPSLITSLKNDINK
jgi:UDP-N-acetylglucosamine transferase subunit ALG13